MPGHVDGDEVALRAVLGQQVSVAAATRLASIITDRYGDTCTLDSTLTRYFPTAAALSAIDPGDLPMPRARGLTFVTLAKALSDGSVRLDAGADREEAARTLGAIKGIGPWTTSYVQMRALGDPDSFLPGTSRFEGPSTVVACRPTRRPRPHVPKRGGPIGPTRCCSSGHSTRHRAIRTSQEES